MNTSERGPSDPSRNADRIPPHSTELERAVLAVILDGRHALAMQQVRSKISHPLAFFDRNHQVIYLACMEIDDDGQPPGSDKQRVEAQAVIDLLRRWPCAVIMERLRHQQELFDAEQLDGMDPGRFRALYRRKPEEVSLGADSALSAIGGANALFDIMQAFATTAGLMQNVDLVWDLYLKRRCI
jgi:hypothetical protein